uniref:Putative ovule protein n=1 Tax=Solanum chacoense TaxID=4108 RepID=A0A0V0H0B3_SOLCH
MVHINNGQDALFYGFLFFAVYNLDLNSASKFSEMPISSPYLPKSMELVKVFRKCICFGKTLYSSSHGFSKLFAAKRLLSKVSNLAVQF